MGRAQQTNQGAVFTFLEENDLAVRTDRHYTQGIKFSFLHRDQFLPGFIGDLWEGLPVVGFENRVGKFGYEVGQNIYTPGDLQATEPLPRDRPYAGWLYLGLVLQRRGLTAGRWLTLESFGLQLGLIGPESLAKESQTWVHELRGFDRPQGWRNQLKTEPGVALRYERAVRFSPEGPAPKYVDVIPHVGTSLGNTETSFRMGVTARLGVNLPENFGIQTITSLVTSEGGWSEEGGQSGWGAYVFTGIEVSLVAYNAFLDGNAFRHSAHVEKEWLIHEWKSGFAVVLKKAEIGFAYVYRSPEFVSQQKDNGYGSVWGKVRF